MNYQGTQTRKIKGWDLKFHFMLTCYFPMNYNETIKVFGIDWTIGLRVSFFSFFFIINSFNLYATVEGVRGTKLTSNLIYGRLKYFFPSLPPHNPPFPWWGGPYQICPSPYGEEWMHTNVPHRYETMHCLFWIIRISYPKIRSAYFKKSWVGHGYPSLDPSMLKYYISRCRGLTGMLKLLAPHTLLHLIYAKRNILTILEWNTI